MHIDDDHLDEVHRREFTPVEGFLAPNELQAARAALPRHFPTHEATRAWT